MRDDISAEKTQIKAMTDEAEELKATLAEKKSAIAAAHREATTARTQAAATLENAREAADRLTAAANREATERNQDLAN